MTARWLPIESNPEVMNKLLHAGGMSKNWALSDVYGLDDGLLACLNQPVVAMLLLFPINDKYNELAKTLEASPGDAPPKDIYYMKQTISNACGTVALIHAVANNLDKVEFAQDSILARFFNDTKDKTPEERAVLLEEGKEICETHDEIAREGSTPAPSLDDSVEFHFVVFVEKEGKVFELDGRKSGPICHGPVADGFLKSAVGAIKKYMDNDPDNIHFTMLALAPAASD